MKGIILSGGRGTRVYPLTKTMSKQLLPVYDKPMIYYPLSTLMLSGISEIALISDPDSIEDYKSLLGDGSLLGISIIYLVQEKPRGIAEAFILAEEFIGNSNVSLVLGDNIFYGNLRLKERFQGFSEGGLVFGYQVKDPERYGVAYFDLEGNVTEIVEKPNNPKSNCAVTGLYLYDNDVVQYAKNLKPSDRGELEITDINKIYLEKGALQVERLGRGVAWLDTGTSESLFEASSFIHSIEKRQSLKIACIEEIAYRMGYIDLESYKIIVKKIPDCDYKSYLKSLFMEFESLWNKEQH